MNKYIKVVLDQESLCKAVEENKNGEGYFCITIEEFLRAISHGFDKIITTQTHAVNSNFYEMGYEIVVICNGKEMKMSDVLAGIGGYTEKEIRLAHNWEKMLLARRI